MSREILNIPNAHEIGVRDIDVNPNNPYYFVTGGYDSRVCFWDSRNVKSAVATYSRHQHWVNRVKYNIYRDALVLSASSCGAVNLWSMSSIAFQNPGTSASTVRENHHVRTFSDHEDGITAISWSCAEANPFLFASLSYDGRVIINRVPTAEIAALTN